MRGMVLTLLVLIYYEPGTLPCLTILRRALFCFFKGWRGTGSLIESLLLSWAIITGALVLLDRK